MSPESRKLARRNCRIGIAQPITGNPPGQLEHLANFRRPLPGTQCLRGQRLRRRYRRQLCDERSGEFTPTP
jgi:hypothetical protein